MAAATVAIITRTQDRPLTLERTARDILNQTYSDWQWVVVPVTAVAVTLFVLPFSYSVIARTPATNEADGESDI